MLLRKTQMRSKRSFCVDIVLACILLGIIAYIVGMVQVNRCDVLLPSWSGEACILSVSFDRHCLDGVHAQDKTQLFLLMLSLCAPPTPQKQKKQG